MKMKNQKKESNRADGKNKLSNKQRQKLGRRSGIVGLVSNTILFVIKYFLGVISNSVAITADAFNNLMDAASSLVTIVGFQIAGRPKDKEHPNGHGRAEYISGFVISTLILVTGFSLVGSAIRRLIKPEPIGEFNKLFVIIPLLSVIIKLGLAGYTLYLEKKVKSATLRAALKDSLVDVVINLIALVPLFVAPLTEIPIDGIAALLVAAVIINLGGTSLWENINLLIGKKVDDELKKEVKKIIGAYKEFTGIEYFLLHDYGPLAQTAIIKVIPNLEVEPNRVVLAANRLNEELNEKYDFEVIVHWNSKKLCEKHLIKEGK